MSAAIQATAVAVDTDLGDSLEAMLQGVNPALRKAIIHLIQVAKSTSSAPRQTDWDQAQARDQRLTTELLSIREDNLRIQREALQAEGKRQCDIEAMKQFYRRREHENYLSFQAALDQLNKDHREDTEDIMQDEDDRNMRHNTYTGLRALSLHQQVMEHHRRDVLQEQADLFQASGSTPS